MMKSRGLRGRKGISPVIATVILVAVAITVAVLVAFWMGGITGQYTRFEKLQVQDPVIEKIPTDSPTDWNLTFTIKNTGASEATIDDVFINQLENSIEIKALSKDKVYSKILNVNLPILRYRLSNGNLILELQGK